MKNWIIKWFDKIVTWLESFPMDIVYTYENIDPKTVPVLVAADINYCEICETTPCETEKFIEETYRSVTSKKKRVAKKKSKKSVKRKK